MNTHMCPICMEESKETKMIKVKCGHFFHPRCLFLWTIQDPIQYREISYYQHDLIPLTSSCPVCRAELKQLFSLYFHQVLPTIGSWISKDKNAYKYLPDSVDAFPAGPKFITKLEDVGFKEVNHSLLTFGVVSLYVAIK